jgi:hypothetical protein
MAEYKRFIQNQFNKVKSSASEFISSRSSNDRETVELELHSHEKLKKIAEAQNTSVPAIMNHIVDQYFASPTVQTVRITADKKEENPLLHLDALCKFEH